MTASVFPLPVDPDELELEEVAPDEEVELPVSAELLPPPPQALNTQSVPAKVRVRSRQIRPGLWVVEDFG